MFDLVILDLQMPISNGYETCAKILDLYKSSGIFVEHSLEKYKPVMIACSAHIDSFVFAMTMKAGFDTSLQCPLNTREVEKKIIPLLEIRKENLKEMDDCLYDEIQ